MIGYQKHDETGVASDVTLVTRMQEAIEATGAALWYDFVAGSRPPAAERDGRSRWVTRSQAERRVA